VIRERYNSTAPGYDELYRAEQYEKYAAALPLAPPRGRVLDAGCGTGLLAEYMRSAGLLGGVTGYVCLDYSREMLRIARWRLDHVCPRGLCHAVGGNVLALPFPDNVFDVVYSFTVLDLVDSVLQALRELTRVSRGPVVVTMLKKLPYKTVLRGLGLEPAAETSKDVVFVLEPGYSPPEVGVLPG